MDGGLDVAGIAPRVREAKLDVARAVLAVRRDDQRAAEVYLRNAQITLTRIELGLPDAPKAPQG